MDPYQTTFNTWNKVAALYQERFMHLELYNDTYDRFCERLEKRGASVLEIGCGPGNITCYLLAQRPDLQVRATDIAPNMIELARVNVPAAQFEVLDARRIDQLTDTFDGVLCGFCLPYLAKEDVAKLFRDVAALLVAGGVYYVSTIEGDYAQSGFEAASTGDSSYVYYYNEAYLRQLLEENGFEEVELVRKPYTKGDGTAQTHLIFIAKKKKAQ